MMPRIIRDWAREKTICDAFRSGLTQSGIARTHNVSRERVRQILFRNGLSGISPARKVIAKNNQKDKYHKYNDLRDIIFSCYEVIF